MPNLILAILLRKGHITMETYPAGKTGEKVRDNHVTWTRDRHVIK